MSRSDDALHTLSFSRLKFLLAVLDDFLPTTIPAEVSRSGTEFVEISFSFLNKDKKTRDTDCIINTVHHLNGKISEISSDVIKAIF